jgi:RNA polymerase sigma-70 factor (ECF subfamily)
MKLQSADIEQLVSEHHAKLYRFAFSLAKNEAEAADLTQQTYFKLVSKGGQLRDLSKAKSWLFTTLYREFLAMRRHSQRFVSTESDDRDNKNQIHIVTVEADAVQNADAHIVFNALSKVRDLYRAPLALFYIDDLSYREIAEVLDVPIGTVMSRLSRGKQDLRALLADSFSAQRRTDKIVPFRRSSNQ